MLAYFENDIPINNALTKSINRLAKDKSRDVRGYSFEALRTRMLYHQAQKGGAADQGIAVLCEATMTYSMSLPEPEDNFGVDL